MKSLNSNVSHSDSRILTTDNINTFDIENAIKLSTENENSKYVKIFERVMKPYSSLNTTWLLQSVRSGQNSTLVDINIRVEDNVESPSIRVVSDLFSPLDIMYDIYYKKASNNVYEFYLKANSAYTSFVLKKIYSSSYINTNIKEFTPTTELEGTKVNKTSRSNYILSECEFTSLNSEHVEITNNSCLRILNMLNIQLELNITEELPVYSQLVKTNNKIQVTKDFYTKIYNTTSEVVALIKANSDGIVIQTGNATLPIGKYQINFTTKCKLL